MYLLLTLMMDERGRIMKFFFSFEEENWGV